MKKRKQTVMKRAFGGLIKQRKIKEYFGFSFFYCFFFLILLTSWVSFAFRGLKGIIDDCTGDEGRRETKIS